jgi:hypothetical protein
MLKKQLLQLLPALSLLILMIGRSAVALMPLTGSSAKIIARIGE